MQFQINAVMGSTLRPTTGKANVGLSPKVGSGGVHLPLPRVLLCCGTRLPQRALERSAGLRPRGARLRDARLAQVQSSGAVSSGPGISLKLGPHPEQSAVAGKGTWDTAPGTVPVGCRRAADPGQEEGNTEDDQRPGEQTEPWASESGTARLLQESSRHP